MKLHYRIPILLAACLCVVLVAVFAVVLAQSPDYPTNYTPGEFQSTNPNYPNPDPFYFEGKIDWNLLDITQPQTTWDYLQRGIHYQDDMNDIPDAMSDYVTSLTMNCLPNQICPTQTCQVVTAANLAALGFTGTGSGLTAPAQITPAPCMFTVRLRLGYLLRNTKPSQAIELFGEVLQIDPQRLGVNTLIAETYVIEAQQATDPATQQAAYANAVTYFQAELALSPVNTALTADTANNSKVHWELAQVCQAAASACTAAGTSQVNELQSYLAATQWHSDVYPWRIALAQNQIQAMTRVKK